MTRVIKFRGKLIKDRQWICGDLVRDNRGYSYIYPEDAEGLYLENRVKNATVGQFTGLRDRNGKEIYEGDIIYSRFGDGSDCLCVVGFDEKLLAFGIMDEYAYRSKLQGYAERYYENGFMHNVYKNSVIFEVRGNIYDNPDMLSRED